MLYLHKPNTRVILILLWFVCVNLAFSKRIYVKVGSSGDGINWANAYPKLQKAINNASAGDKIWVAAGTYRPTANYDLDIGNRGKHFRLKNGVAIFGGFAGTETALKQRKVKKNKTILSGDIGVKGDSSDNCYHVFYHPAAAALEPNAVLDGFTITAGNADSVDIPHDSGGGMYNEASSPTVKNCTFSNNSADVGGGMMNENSANPVVTNCTFKSNTADFGGGVYNYTDSNPTVKNCTFRQNFVWLGGGGMANDDSSPTVTGCTFSSNVVDLDGDYGGGISNFSYSDPNVINCTFSGNAAYAGGGMSNEENCSPTVTNCTFSGNIAIDYGGGMANLYDCSPTLTNCTFSGNTSDFTGGGMDNYTSSPTIINSIFWGNVATDEGNEIYNDPYDSPLSEPLITYCNIQGGLPAGSSDGGGNLDSDPMFMDADGSDDTVGTTDDDLQLKNNSPCIDAADGDLAPTTDLLGNPRYDHPMDDIGTGTPTYVDMGAYERLGVTVDSPTEAELWVQGSSYSINWSTNSPSTNVKILLFKDGSKVSTLKSTTANDGEWQWTVPGDLPHGTGYKVKVVCIDDGAFGFSDLFEIVRPGDLYTPIEVTDPNGTSVWDMGSQVTINWTGADQDEEVKIQLRKGKKLIKTIKTATENNGTLDWTVPYNIPAGTNYKIKVISTDYSYVFDVSPKFEIRIPPIEVTVPPAGKEWKRGYTYPIKWTGGKPSQDVKIELWKAGALKKTLTASTPNDGLFKWKVPNKFALGSDYSIKVTYLPDTTMWDASEDFSIINSLVGTWNGSWTHEEYGATTQVSMILRKDSKVRGSTSQPMAPYGMEGTLTLDLTGAYTYNPDDGSVELIDVVGEGFHAEKETPVRVRLLEASGTVANNTITVDASFVVESIPWPSTEWEEYKSFSDTFVLKR